MNKNPSALQFRLGFNANIFTTPKIRGFARHTLNLIQAIHEIAPQVDIRLYANRELSPLLVQKMPFAKVRIWPVRPYFLWEQFILPAHLAFDNVDIFHSTMNTGAPFLRPFYSSTVQTVHDHFTHQQLAHAPRNFIISHWRAYLGFKFSWMAAMSSDAMISVSEYSRAELESRYPQLQEKISVIPNAADPIFSKGPVDRDVLLRFGLDSGYILYVGGFDERKNIPVLLSAYEKFSQGEPMNSAGKAPKLVLVGALDGVEPHLRGRMEKIPGVVTLAYCADEVLAHLYRGAMFGVFPSRQEGFGFPALEFFSSGVPVVLSDIPAFREVARDAAPYFPPDDANALAKLMERMSADESWRLSWLAKAGERARHYDWHKIASDTLSVYQRLLS